MGIIKVMDEVLANKIAAGEVVEKIASVVKELCENSIDAGSKNIKIELLSSGLKQIKVIDDGKGMDKEDAVLAFSRHATSKIKTENDLYFINSLGFRGEALASIASVSKIKLETCKDKTGTLVTIEGGKNLTSEVGSVRKGTSIEVNNLFYNTPARLKFLKSLNTELANAVNVIERLALSHPSIAFSLSNDNREIINTSGSSDLYKTIHEIFGFNVSKNMIHIQNSNYDFEIEGYISNINLSKSNRNSIITLVNERVVQNRDINRFILDAYHTALSEGKYPIIVLNIETDPTLVDVNIHPTKQDIKLTKLNELEDLIFTTIKNVLSKSDNIVNAMKEDKTGEIEEEKNISVDDLVTQETFSFEENKIEFIKEESSIYNKEEKSLIKPVGLALGTYLFAQEEEMVYMIDIHAANERINYEIYLDNLKNQIKNNIDLLFPISIELTKNEYLLITEHMNILENLGFKISEFGINTFRIESHPVWLKEGHEEESIRKIFDLVLMINDKFNIIDFNEKLAITLACKMSVKANTNISYEEQEALINRLFKCEFPYTCPHGRPTIIKYTKYELEKLFKRVV